MISLLQELQELAVHVQETFLGFKSHPIGFHFDPKTPGEGQLKQLILAGFPFQGHKSHSCQRGTRSETRNWAHPGLIGPKYGQESGLGKGRGSMCICFGVHHEMFSSQH